MNLASSYVQANGLTQDRILTFRCVWKAEDVSAVIYAQSYLMHVLDRS